MDSSRTAEPTEERRTVASKVSGRRPEPSLEEATFDRALADSEAAVRKDEMAVLQEVNES